MRCMISWGSSASLAPRPDLGTAPSITTSRNQRVQCGDIRLLHLVETVLRHTPVELLQPEKDENGCNSHVHNEVEHTHRWFCMQVVVNCVLVPTCGAPPSASVDVSPRARRPDRPGSTPLSPHALPSMVVFI